MPRSGWHRRWGLPAAAPADPIRIALDGSPAIALDRLGDGGWRLDAPPPDAAHLPPRAPGGDARRGDGDGRPSPRLRL